MQISLIICHLTQEQERPLIHHASFRPRPRPRPRPHRFRARDRGRAPAQRRDSGSRREAAVHVLHLRLRRRDGVRRRRAAASRREPGGRHDRHAVLLLRPPAPARQSPRLRRNLLPCKLVN